MSEEQENYRPRSPDLSGFVPPPSLKRLPSYVRTPSESAPSGHSFSPRSSIDRRPSYFSQSTTNPLNYFNTQNIESPSTYSPQYARAPSFSSQQYQPPPLQSFAPQVHHQSPTFTSPSFSPAQLSYPSNYSPTTPSQLSEMARTRAQRNAEDNDHDYEPTPSIHAQPLRPVPESVKVEVNDEPEEDPALTLEIKTKFPVARIKRIMQADEDVGKVAQATPSAVAKALELFMVSLTIRAATVANNSNSRRITAQHLKASIITDKQFDFLENICADIPSVEEKGKKGRSKSEHDDSEERDAMPRKKSKAGGERKKSETPSD